MGTQRTSRTLTVPSDAAVKWLADENFDNNIVRGLLRRSPALDIVRAQDIVEIAGSDDFALLMWSSRHGRTVLTHDLSTMVPATQEFPSTTGELRILLVRDSLPIAHVMDDILLLDECSKESDWSAGVLYLPLR
jgi:hypothetical protein